MPDPIAIAEQEQSGVDYKVYVEPLLEFLKWEGNKRDVLENLPYLMPCWSPNLLKRIMSQLHFECNEWSLDLSELDERLLPILFIQEDQLPLIIYKKSGNQFIALDPVNHKTHILQPKGAHGQALNFKPTSVETDKVALRMQHKGWFTEILERHRFKFIAALAFSLFFNLLMLGTPLFVMGVYNMVLATGSTSMLSSFMFGILIVFATIGFLSALRGELFSYISTYLDKDVGVELLRRVLYLSPGFTETANIESQVARLRDFEAVREFLGGSMLIILFELPFTLVFLAAIFFLAGKIVLIPMASVMIFILVGMLIAKRIKLRAMEAAQQNSHKQEFMIESMNQMLTLKHTNALGVWKKRFREISGETALQNMRMSMSLASVNVLADAMLLLTGLSTMLWGVHAVLAQELSLGGLVATMILIWRALTPTKTLFTALPRLQQVSDRIAQINRLMRIQPESAADYLILQKRCNLKGHLELARVSFRYPDSPRLVLSNAAFTLHPQRSLGIIGPSGSGKSTMMKLILGMYPPTVGNIYFDGQESRQFNPIRLRQAIGYVPQNPTLFHGSLKQNITLQVPEATTADIEQACRKANLWDDIQALPEGLGTFVNESTRTTFSRSFRQRVALASAFLKNATIYLFDEPAAMLDEESDKVFLQTLQDLKQRATILMISHRPSHLKSMDNLYVLHEGQAVMAGPTAEVLPKVPKDYL